METTESCTCCEKFVVSLTAANVLSSLRELPNTYDAARKSYVWREFGMMAYAVIPRSTERNSGTVDLYLCADEDILDDEDSIEMARRLLHEHILPAFPGCREVSLLQPALAAPLEVGCWKLRHKGETE